MTTKEAIEHRRSIRKYHPTPIPDAALTEILHAARLAPSGANTQPWCFKVVSDAVTKTQLVRAANHQTFLATAPTIIVCCADIERYVTGMLQRFPTRAASLRTETRSEITARLAIQVTIAIEHMVLRALDFELGTCWVRSLQEQQVREIFGWDEHLYVVALLPIGYPAECPAPRPRLQIEDILL